MNILVLLKMVPDIVEELEVGPDGTSLDPEVQRLIINERDDHALEQALLLKDKHGGSVVAVALDGPEVDDVLFTALAKGVDRAIKVAGAEPPLTTAQTAALLAGVVPGQVEALKADLIITGCWAIDDLDGVLGPTLAERMHLPYLGIVTGVEVGAEAGRVTVKKEFSGGVHGVFSSTLPAVLGIQAAASPPRYVPVAKVRATMKTAKIESVSATPPDTPSLVAVVRMTKPEAAGHAEMFEGEPEDVAAKVVEVLSARGLL